MELREGLGKKLKPFSTNKKQGLQRLCTYLGGVCSGLLGFNTPPFSLTLNSEMGNKVWDKEVNYKVTRGTVLGGSVLHRALLLLGLVVSTLI